MKRKRLTRRHEWLTPLVLLLLWQAIALLIRRPLVPQPWQVLYAMATRYPLELIQAIGASLLRVAAGVLLSAVAGLGCAVISALWPRAERAIYPAVYFLHPLPKIALMPVVMLLFGLGETSKILIIFLICFFQFAQSARDAIKSAPEGALALMASLGASRGQIVRMVYLPAAWPALLGGLRLCLGTALSVLFFTETFGSQIGIGAFILDAWMRVSYIEMYSGILALSITGYLLYRGIDRAAQQ